MKSNKINDKSKMQKLDGTKMGENDGKLTLEELRNCEGFADVSDVEGLGIIENLYQFSLIAYNYKPID
jgi:hypothetical protein